MITLRIEARARPPPDLASLHRIWWISWQYGDEHGVVLGATCRCETLCRDHLRPGELRETLRAAIAAGIRRQHHLLP